MPENVSSVYLVSVRILIHVDDSFHASHGFQLLGRYEMSSSSQNRRQGRPLPVIDLAQLLGPNFRQRFTPAVGRLNQNVEPEPNQPQQQDEKASNVARMPQNNSSEVPRNRDDNIDNTGHLKPAAKRKSSMSASTNATAKTSSRARNTINQDTQCRGSAEGELAGASAKRDGSIASMATANPEKKRQSSADAMVASKPKKKTALTETSAGVQTQVFTKASGISLFSSNRCVPLEMTPSQVSM